MNSLNHPDWLVQLLEMEDRHRAVVELSQLVLRGTPMQRSEVRRGWPFGAEWPYPTPSRLACVIREAHSPRERLVASLILDSLEGVWGTREHQVAQCLSFHSALLAGLVPADVFKEVAPAILPNEAAELDAFLQREPAEQTLAAFGLVATRNAEGETEIDLRL